jgi:hypothetical protein
VPYRNAFRFLVRHSAALLLLLPAGAALARTSSQESISQLSMQVNDDRMTLSMARVPQIYLYGPIDADAPRRFEALMKSGRVPTGSDVYLNSPGGSVEAGMALGRLFRQGAMVTHLGTPRQPRHGASVTINKPALCEDACAYAYLGGLYRWSVSGADRIGFPTYPAQRAPAAVDAYLKDMGIAALALTTPATTASASSSDPMLWPTGDEMIAKGLANNGRQDLIATYRFVQGMPYLELKQSDRNGDHRITFQCKHGSADLATYDTIGAIRARQIVAREARSYFEINQQETLPQQPGATAVDQSVVIRRAYPLDQLSRVASAQALGAWVRDRTGIRYGFAFEVGGVRKILNDFYNACVQVAQQHS